MFNYLVICGIVMYGVTIIIVTGHPTIGIINGIKPTNILGGPEQHASFNFIRPGLTQTSYSFNGPSSHQTFSSTIGNPQLAHKVLPNVARALSYKNPGLGYFANGPISTAFTSSPSYLPSGSVTTTPSVATLSYNQLSLDQPMPLAYWQHNGQLDPYHNQLNQISSSRQAQLYQLLAQGQAHVPHQSQSLEQLQWQNQDHHHHHHHIYQQQQQQQQLQNLLGASY